MQLAAVTDSPEQGLEPLRGPRDREGENDAEPTDEGDPVGQEGLEGLGQLCLLGTRKETCIVLLSHRQVLAGPQRRELLLPFLPSLLQGWEKNPDVSGSFSLEGLN